MISLLLNHNNSRSRNQVDGERFIKFLEICFSHSDAVSFSKRILTGYDNQPSGIEQLLEPYLIKCLYPQKWYGYPVISDPLAELVYTADSETLQIISSCYTDLFLKNKKKLPNTKFDSIGYLPKHASPLEDICFWQDKRMLVGSLSHEFICSTNYIDDEFASQLQSAADFTILDNPVCCIEEITY